MAVKPKEGSERANIGAMAKKTLILYFLLDTSESMEHNGGIAALNQAMHNVESTFGDDITQANKDYCTKFSKNSDVLVKIAILKFSSGAEWVTEPTELDSDIFSYHDLTAGGVTDMGEAFLELESKLHTNAHLNDPEGIGFKVPAFLLLSDGAATDDFESGLKKLNDNQWFKNGSKIAIGFGNADKNQLEKFTGNPESVLMTYESKQIIHLIQLFTMHASQIGSGNANSKDKQDELTDSMKDNLPGKDKEADPEKDYSDADWK